MSQPLEAKLRRLRELNAKAEKLKVDVNRLWRRFPPLPGSYVGMGIGVPEGDPQLTRTVTTNTTAPHEACKRIFMTCVESVFTIDVLDAECGAAVSDTSLIGLSYTFDSSVFSADKCDSAWDEIITEYRHGIKSEVQCDVGTFTVESADRFIVPNIAPVGSYPCSGTLTGLSLILSAARLSSGGPLTYWIRIGQGFSGSGDVYRTLTELDTSPDGWLPGCGPDELAIGESRTLNNGYVDGATPWIEVLLTRVS